MHTLRQRLRAAVTSFWFVPALLMVAMALLAQGLVMLDRLFAADLSRWAFVSGIGASGSRDLLAAIGGSMLGVAATAFSITISVIATASSTYGPRLVQNFMANRGNQVVLGVFGATFLYALLVLRTIREGSSSGGEFVPHLAVTAAIVLAVLDVAVLVYFIHHIADSIQVPTLASQVLGDLQRCVAREDPTPDVQQSPPAADGPVHPVRASSHGFLQYVDHASLVGLASRHDVVIRLPVRAGDHVIAGDVLATVELPGETDTDALETGVRRALTFGTSRTADQDVRHAAQQLAELAVRALSPGTNDPYTAINAIIELGTGLAPLVAEPDPGDGYHRDGRLRLVDRPVPVAEVLDLVFDQIRPHAAGTTEVVLALLELQQVLTDHTDRPDVRARLAEHRDTLVRVFTATGPDERDLDRVTARAGV